MGWGQAEPGTDRGEQWLEDAAPEALLGPQTPQVGMVFGRGYFRASKGQWLSLRAPRWEHGSVPRGTWWGAPGAAETAPHCVSSLFAEQLTGPGDHELVGVRGAAQRG